MSEKEKKPAGNLDKQINIRFPGRVLEELGNLAQEEDLKIADIIRRAVREHLKALGKKRK
jgi:hypothetical protein